MDVIVEQSHPADGRLMVTVPMIVYSGVPTANEKSQSQGSTAGVITGQRHSTVDIALPTGRHQIVQHRSSRHIIIALTTQIMCLPVISLAPPPAAPCIDRQLD